MLLVFSHRSGTLVPSGLDGMRCRVDLGGNSSCLMQESTTSLFSSWMGDITTVEDVMSIVSVLSVYAILAWLSLAICSSAKACLQRFSGVKSVVLNARH